jgi:23S rRNA (cytidine2498-2'-O)-methyltransferase
VTRLDAYLTSPGYEAALAAEIGGPRGSQWPGVVSKPTPDPLKGVASGLRPQASGLVLPDLSDEGSSGSTWPEARGPRPEAVPDPVWARQQLPGAFHLKADSVKALAAASYEVLQESIDEAAAGFTLHAYVPDPEAYGHLAARADLIGAELMELLQQRRRRAFRRHVPAAEAAARWGELLVVQLGLVGRTSLLVSAARPRALALGGFDLAPWPAGIAPVAEDRAAPSRAYGKLEEAFAWMGAAPAPGQQCVDLGGAPGGWAWKALQRGARVVAVDRAKLAPPAADHPALEMVQGNAFTYEPSQPVDWLLCDVICEPSRTVELVDRWMTRGWCRAVVATLKFKGASDYGMLAPARAHLAVHGWRHLRLKHLFRHHNEVAITTLR